MSYTKTQKIAHFGYAAFIAIFLAFFASSVAQAVGEFRMGAQGQGQASPAMSQEEMTERAMGQGQGAAQGMPMSPEKFRELQEKYRAVKGVMPAKQYTGKHDLKDCICTMEFAPVCGVTKDGEFKTFSNKCRMACEGAKFVSEGECQAKDGMKIKKPPFGGVGPFDPAPLPERVKEMKKKWEDEDGNTRPMPWESKRETEDRSVEYFNGGFPPINPEMRMIDIEDLLNTTGPTFPEPNMRGIREGGRTVGAGQHSARVKGVEEEYGLEPVSAAPVMVAGKEAPVLKLELKTLPKALVVSPEKAKELQNKWLPIKRATVVKVDGDALEAKEIKINEDKTVEVKAKKKAKLLGIFDIELELEAKVDANGEVKEIKKPWWSFFAW